MSDKIEEFRTNNIILSDREKKLVAENAKLSFEISKLKMKISEYERAAAMICNIEKNFER